MVFKMQDSVPSARYSTVSNVLRLWKISFIPIDSLRLYNSENSDKSTDKGGLASARQFKYIIICKIYYQLYVTVYAKRGYKSGKIFPRLLCFSQLYGHAHIYATFCAGRLYTFRVTPIFIRGYRKRCLRETAIFM